MGDVASSRAAAVRFENSNEKARGGFLRAGFRCFCDDDGMPVICPTCQIFFEGVNKLRKIRQNRFDNLKLSLSIRPRQIKTPLPISRPGLYDIGDNVGVPLICPTRQVSGRFRFGADIENKVVGRLAAEPTARRIARRPSMYFAAVVLAVLSGMFYAASHHEIGSFGVTMCQYGSPFCDNPLLVFVGACLAALWGIFVSVR
jgi:hypothetical protein